MSSRYGRPVRPAPPLRLLVSPPVTPASLYDETIAEVWVLALALHDRDVARAADAVTQAYSRAWAGSHPGRTSVLRALVEAAPARHSGNVAPLLGRRRGARRPAPGHRPTSAPA